MHDAARGLFATVFGIAIGGAGLYLLAEEISGNLVPLGYFALIAAGAALLVRGLRAFQR